MEFPWLAKKLLLVWHDKGVGTSIERCGEQPFMFALVNLEWVQ